MRSPRPRTRFAAGLAILAALGAGLWLATRPAEERAVAPAGDGGGPGATSDPPREATPVLAGRGRRAILPASAARERAPGPPFAEDPSGPGAAAPEGPAGQVPPLPPLVPGEPGRVRLRLVVPDGTPLPRTAEVVRGALATGMEWEGTVWIRDGDLVVEGVPEGEQQVVVDVGDWAPVVLAVRARDGLETDVGPVVLSVGHALSGLVVDAQGVPVPRAEVRAAGRRRVTRTDASGAFAVDRLPPGPVDVEAEADGFLMTEIEAEAGREREVRIVLERTARVEGTLVGPDGRPSAFVRLVLVDVGAAGRPSLEPFAFRTDEDGTFEIEAVPGRYRVEMGQDPLGYVLVDEVLVGGRLHRLALRRPPER